MQKIIIHQEIQTKARCWLLYKKARTFMQSYNTQIKISKTGLVFILEQKQKVYPINSYVRKFIDQYQFEILREETKINKLETIYDKVDWIKIDKINQMIENSKFDEDCEVELPGKYLICYKKQNQNIIRQKLDDYTFFRIVHLLPEQLFILICLKVIKKGSNEKFQCNVEIQQKSLVISSDDQSKIGRYIRKILEVKKQKKIFIVLSKKNNSYTQEEQKRAYNIAKNLRITTIYRSKIEQMIKKVNVQEFIDQGKNYIKQHQQLFALIAQTSELNKFNAQFNKVNNNNNKQNSLQQLNSMVNIIKQFMESNTTNLKKSQSQFFSQKVEETKVNNFKPQYFMQKQQQTKVNNYIKPKKLPQFREESSEDNIITTNNFKKSNKIQFCEEKMRTYQIPIAQLVYKGILKCENIRIKLNDMSQTYNTRFIAKKKSNKQFFIQFKIHESDSIKIFPELDFFFKNSKIYSMYAKFSQLIDIDELNNQICLRVQTNEVFRDIVMSEISLKKQQNLRQRLLSFKIFMQRQQTFQYKIKQLEKQFNKFFKNRVLLFHRSQQNIPIQIKKYQ